MPLTGVPLEFGQTVPDRPALVVKIDNNPRARPQSGLNAADIVFEEIVEYGTRFAAVFHSGDANPVGPIRSGRTQDIDLLGGLQRPLFAWSGGNPGVTQAIADSDFVDLNPSGVPGGTYGRQGNNGNAAQLLLRHRQAVGVGQRGGGATGADVRATSTPACCRRAIPAVELTSGWTPTACCGSTTRGAAPTGARRTGRRTRTATQATRSTRRTSSILETPYRPSYVDSNSPEAVTIGGGPVWVLSGGTVRTGSWMRGSREEGIGLYAADGSVIELLPGRTWVELADPVDGAPVIS